MPSIVGNFFIDVFIVDIVCVFCATVLFTGAALLVVEAAVGVGARGAVDGAELSLLPRPALNVVRFQ